MVTSNDAEEEGEAEDGDYVPGAVDDSVFLEGDDDDLDDLDDLDDDDED